MITDQLGRVLGGRYRLDAGIGTGSSAYVYAATDLALQRVVAVKVLQPALSNDEGFLRRFRAEAHAAASLDHPNLLRVLDWGEGEDGAYLVLDHLRGGSLRGVLDAGLLLDHAQAVRAGAEAAHGLAYAHRRGFVHRDIKPDNLMLDDDGHVRIADFGMARALAEAAWTEPVGAVIGSARYASPEQAEGRPLDDRSDVYSLALVLYELLVGRVPFSGDTTVATLMARLGAALPRAPELGPLAPILAQAAIPEPLARLDAAELAIELDLLARTLPPPRRLVPPLPAPAGAGNPWPPAGRRGGTLLFVDGLGVDGLGVDERAAGAVEGETDPRSLRRPAPSAGSSRRADPDVRSRRRRRRRAVAVVAVVAAVAGAAAGGDAAYRHYVVFGHHVPAVSGESLAAARLVVADRGLRLRLAGRRYSTAAPAGVVLGQQPAPGKALKSGAAVSVLVSLGHAPVALPAGLDGKARAAALSSLRRLRFVTSVRLAYEEQAPAGTVVSVAPPAGSLPYRARIRVVVSRGPAPRTIPALSPGAGWQQEAAALSALRLQPIEELAYSDTVPSGSIVSVSPAPGTTGVTVGSRVTVTVSEGPQLVAVPPVSGDSIASAVAALRAAGLVVSEQIGPPFATSATTTDPAPGTQLRPGTSVTLYVA